MSVLQKLKSALPVDQEESVHQTYECRECGNTFDSAKTPDRAKCMECMSEDVQQK